VAGAAAVTGVLACDPALQWALAGACVALGAWALWRRDAAILLLCVALLAGQESARGLALRTARALAILEGAWARAPPRNATCELEVEACAEDLFRGRAWLEGRRDDGLGVLCVWQGDLPDDLGPGAQVRIAGRFSVPHRSTNPGQRDGGLDLAARGLSLVADVRIGANVELLRPPPPGPTWWLDRIRRRGVRRLTEVVPPHAAGLCAALLFGVRSGVDAEDRVLFQHSGTVHVLAISGMHLVVLAGFLHLLLRRAGCGPRLAAGITLAFCLLYVPVAGNAPPVRRAATMVAFYALALVRGRVPDPASALGGAALVLALATPEDVSRIGFRLSFAAATGIAWLAGSWRERWGRRHRLLARFPAVRSDRPVRLRLNGFVLAGLPVSLAAWCATQGFVAAAFGIVTPLAPLTNLVVAPVVGLLLTLTALVAAGAGLLAGPVSWIVHGMRGLLELAGACPGAYLLVPPPPGAAVAAWCLGCVGLRRRAWRGLALLLLAVLLAAGWPSQTGPCLVLLDVGNGQAALLRFDDGSTVLVDGGSRSRPRVGPRVVVPALRALGVRRLEAAVCSHADADHWNALPDVLATLPVARVVAGREVAPALARAAALHGVPLERARAGQIVHAAGKTSLRVFLADGPRGSSNDRSLVLLFRVGNRRALLPGDREEAGLAELVAASPPPCEVLVAPHHGAACSDAEILGRALRPEVLLVSAGETMVDPVTVAAYGAPRIYGTARRGALRVEFPDHGEIEVACHGPDRAEDRATIRAP
jgi:competence protein ComEC